MSVYSLLALLITGVIGVASPTDRGRYFLSRYIKLIFIVTVITVFILSGYFTFKQYETWANDPLAQFLLPPYQSLNYFISYSLIQFFAPYLISLVVALLFLKVTLSLNRKSGEIFFEEEEPYLAATSIFLVGHPGWLIYVVALIAVYLLLHTTYYLLQKKSERLPLYYLWAPTAFFVILLNEYWLSTINWWQLLVI